MNKHELERHEVTKYGYGDMPYAGTEQRCSCGVLMIDNEQWMEHRIDVLFRERGRKVTQSPRCVEFDMQHVPSECSVCFADFNG